MEHHKGTSVGGKCPECNMVLSQPHCSNMPLNIALTHMATIMDSILSYKVYHMHLGDMDLL